MKPARLLLLLCLGLAVSGCGPRRMSGLLDSFNSQVLKAQVALEDAVNSPRRAREAESYMVERQALQQAEGGLQEVDAHQAELLVREQQVARSKQEADDSAAAENPLAGRPAEELSSQLPP